MSLINRFKRDERGTVAIIFAMMLVPLVMLIGFAVDVGRANFTKMALQNAVDSAALAGAMEYRDSGDASKAKLKADNYLKNNAKAVVYPYTHTWTIDDAQLAMTGTAQVFYPTAFVAIMGFTRMEINVTTIAMANGKELELAVMVDTTGSMGETSGKGDSTSKMVDLKAAMKDMLDVFDATLKRKRAKIGIAPFSEGVYAGSNATVLRGAPAITKTISNTPYLLTKCVSERTNGDAYTDAYGNMGALYNSSGTCAEAAKPTALTDQRSILDAAVNKLTDSGGTAGHLGVAWAWYLLAPTWQSYFGTQVVPYNDKKTMKAALLMTDGEFNLQYCKSVSDQAKGNCAGINSGQQAKALCAAMKAKGIIVYTVGFDINTSVARDVLETCASPGKYYAAFNGAGIKQAFVAIGKELLQSVRLTQ